ncbi:hypothetical protein KGQ71_00800 [Patescibacteria group bacterium]|nr:hypothetical protein [Patescibacteria group bacterium]
MKFLRSVGVVLLFVLIGAGVGLLAFYLQHGFPRVTSASTTPTPAPTAAPEATYTDTDSQISFPLPKNSLISESSLQDSTGALQGKTLRFYTKASDTTLKPTSLTVYIINKAESTTSYSTSSQAAFIRKITTGYRLESGSLNKPPERYLAADGATLDLYQKDTENAEVVIVNAGSADQNGTVFSASDIAAILNALTVHIPTPAAPTTTQPSATTSALLNL